MLGFLSNNCEDLILKSKSKVKNDSTAIIDKLIKKGAKIANPAAIEIGPEVEIERLSGDGVVIYAGCKIYGKDTLILPGVKLGYEAPVTVDDCQIGPDVELKGGYLTSRFFWIMPNAAWGLRCARRPFWKSRPALPTQWP